LSHFVRVDEPELAGALLPRDDVRVLGRLRQQLQQKLPQLYLAWDRKNTTRYKLVSTIYELLYLAWDRKNTTRYKLGTIYLHSRSAEFDLGHKNNTSRDKLASII
jgi:hypothetical protein